MNETKSAVARPQERKLLGFSFSTGPEIKRMIAPKALDRFKQRIREITRKAKGVSIEKTIAELASYMRGWRGYFGFCETPVVLEYLTRWVRLRLRAVRCGGNGKHRAVAARLCWNWEFVRDWPATRPVVDAAPGTLLAPRPSRLGFPTRYFKSLGLPTLIDGC